MKIRGDGSLDPYRIFVSEIMLQQTQTSRVVEKYRRFIKLFPNFQSLAAASTADVLWAWQGLGYNRRALFLQRAARIVTGQWNGVLPADPARLVTLPGVGPNTAGSIAAFAFNKPVVFIETNIRRVFLHFFFKDAASVPDAAVREYVSQTLDSHHPRDWYYALMDYGAMLAKTIPNPNRRSRHYAKQSRFEGSFRQVRGEILRFLDQAASSTAGIAAGTGRESAVVAKALMILEKEGFIARDRRRWKLAGVERAGVVR
ncbi:MAG TPA: A/G-specific adenine glycosylase [Candidatus Paceibacterota bacterium]|nr:A/G-specific adenine glycosylase [Candidatus Paceibacterota bacterium]